MSRALLGAWLALTLGAVTGRADAPRAAPGLWLDLARNGPDLFAVGERGAIVMSGDSGKTWARVASPTAATLTGIAFAPDGRHGWATGHDAVILATEDGGLTWRPQWQGADLEASLLDIHALDARHVIAVGAYGLFLVTQDGGLSWTTQKVIEDDMHLNRITRGPSGTLYIAGERGTLLRSHDRGASWDRLETPYDGSFYGVLPLAEQTLLVHGLRGQLFLSEDDGNSWRSVALDRPLLVATAVRLPDGRIYLAGQAGAVYVNRPGRPFAFSPLSGAPGSAIAELIEAPDGSVVAVGEAGAAVLP